MIMSIYAIKNVVKLLQKMNVTLNIRCPNTGRVYRVVQTSKPAVAERPRDASCLSVALIVQYIELKFRFRFTAAYK